MNQRSTADLFDIARISCLTSLRSKKKSLQLLAELIESSLQEDQLDDSVDMEVIDALAARERLGCTGLGFGVAIPHGRVDFINHPIGAAVTLAEPIDFDSPDGQPVDIIVGLLIPETEIDGHLQILATLARFFNQEDNRRALREAPSADAIHALLQSIDFNPPDSDQNSNAKRNNDTKD